MRKMMIKNVSVAIIVLFFQSIIVLTGSQAYEKIPKKYIDICAAQDHIIAWYEFRKLSKKNGMVENAVEHIEPDSLIKLFKKQWRWGRTTKDFYKTELSDPYSFQFQDIFGRY